MGYLFFEILSEIAHFKNHKQVKNIHMQIQLTINAIQHLALLFPNNGWKIWNYSDDSALSYFQRLLNYFLILPITKAPIFEIIVFFLFVIQISICFIIGFFVFKRKIVAKAKFTKGIFQILLSLVNFYFQNINLAINIPILLFYINGILCNEQFQEFATTYTCSLAATFYISIFGTILTVISQSLTIYFFRSYTFKPFSLLQSKYSANSFISIALRPIAIFLFCFQQSQFQNDIFFIAYNFLLIVLIIDSYYVNSYHPPHNDFNFKLFFSIFAISALVTLSVLSSKTKQTLILVETMLIGAAAYNISITIVRRRLYHKPHSQLFAQCKTVDLVQRVNQLFEEQQEQFFVCYILIINHLGQYEKNSNKKIINQFLSNQLRYARANGKMAFEQVQLVYIDFLLNFRKKPLVSLVEFKKYEIYNQRQQTFYFSQMKKFINDDIEKQVQKQQQQQHEISEQEKQSLDIKHISKSLIFEDLYIPSFIKIIDQKIKFWQQSIKGYDSIYDFQEVAINFSKKVQELQKLLMPSLSFDIETHLNSNCNVLELKIASIFYSTVMNDYYNSAQCEFLITEILNIEHVLSQNIITNLTLIEDKVVLIMISLIKNLGQITNKDKRSISAYFGYDEKQFQSVQHINQLMPPYLSAIHDNLLKDYLQKAKSKLFSSYYLVFSSDQSGFLIPQQLKIDNNFNIKDDYVIMGCMSQIKKGVDFLLFGEDGKIWGCTENFFSSYIVSNNENMTLQKFVCSCYIYMLIPQLIKIIDSYKKKYIELLNEAFTIEETASLIVSHDLFDLMTQFSLCYKDLALNETSKQRNYHKLSDDSKSGITRRNLSVSEKEKQVDPEIFYEQSEEHIEQKGQIRFLNKEIQSEINSILTSINYQTTEKYFAKFSLSCKSFGKENYRRQYFIIEFHDIRKRDLIGQSISTTNQVNQYETKYQSIQNNQDQTQENQSNQSNLNLSGFTQNDQPSSEIVPPIKDIGCGIAEGVKRMGRSKKNKLEQDNGQYNLDSGRDSLSYGPLSQRAHFINPNQQNEHLFEKIDQDFNEMDIQLNSASAILQQQRQEQFEAQGEFEIDDSINKKQQQEQGKSSSVKEKKNQIINIIHKNQMKGKTHEGEELDALKSKSSITSGTSGNQAIQLIKQFQSLTHLTYNLKLIAYITASIFIILLILIVVNVVIIYLTHVNTENNINDIYGPLILSRNYLEILSFSWSMILDALEIVPFSAFMKKQQMDDLKLMSSTLNEKLYSLFSAFVEVEQRGLLSSQLYTFLNGEQEEMLFPYFINLIQLNLNRVAQITEVQEFSQILNYSFLNELFFLRFNLNQIQSTTSELIDSLNLIFINQTLAKATEMKTQVIVEIVCIGIFLIIELYCWKQVMNYCQLLMLLTGRLQESDANELIARATLVKETLLQQEGKFSWKRQNYYSLNYQQLNTLNLDLSTQSKILKDLIQKNNQDVNFEMKQQKNTKRNVNVVLSSRIQNTSINFAPYILMVSSVFLILSFIFFGGFLLFQQQTNDLGPSQTLLANYIKFSSKMDTMVTCSLITKTQPLLYHKLIELEVYDNQTINSFSNTTDVIVMFTDLNEVYSENLTAIFNDILISTKISESVKQEMFTLFQNSFCEWLSSEIPMCNIDTMGLEAFSNEYGTPDLKLDDNREFISKGISGVESHLDVLYQLLFYYEQDNLQFQPDLELSQYQANQMEFRSGIFDHFLDTNDGTNKFFDLIYTSTLDILDQNLVYMQLYYGILGFAIVICYAIFYITFIIHTNNKLIRIRLALITLPISIITDQHTISLLKKLS